MFTEQQKKQLDQAIDAAGKWAVTGWPMAFGPYQKKVNSLAEARSTPKNVQHWQEALAYWEAIEEAGAETVEKGKSARTAMDAGDGQAAHNAVYFATFVEKKIHSTTPTWGPVLAELNKVLGK